MTQFTIGADPEIFLKSKGRPISAHDIIKGTKKEPFPIPGGAYQVDGLATEFNIDPIPIGNHEEFNKGIVSVMKQLHADVKAAAPSASFMKETSVEFSKEYLAELPREVLVLGCDPDWNAYTLAKNPTPDGDVPFRATGGHIHLGWDKDMPVDDPEYIKICADIVKVLDLLVGLPCRILDPDDRRREMYGKAGAFRPKPYGLEYRTPSSIWIHSKATRVGVSAAVHYAVSALHTYKTSERLFKARSLDENSIRAAIDGDFGVARSVYERAKWFLPYGRVLDHAIKERTK